MTAYGGDFAEQAACRDVGPHLFDTESNRRAGALAEEFCARCPVSTECLELAMDNEQGLASFHRAMVYAGTTPLYRARLAKRQGRKTKQGKKRRE